MEFVKFLFVLIQFVVVINRSYSFSFPVRHLTINRLRVSAPVLRTCEVPVLKNGSVRLRQRGKLIRYLCLPTFTLIGDKYSSCIQGQWENPVPMCIKPGCPTVPPPENGFTVVDKNGALTMLFCKVGYSIAGSPQTYCDGTVWDRSLGSCRETQTSPAMSCDFEVSSICDWVSDPTHDFEWSRKNGYTSVKQLQTGPTHDHTVGIPLEGHFMLATFANQLPSSVARLISPLYPASASQNACFRMYYHMYGATTGVLRVYVKPESVAIADILDSPKYLFLEKLGTFENAWLEAVFNIDQYDEDFQIVIEATATRTTRSNIAIDDVALLSDADCVNEEFKSTSIIPEENGIFDAQSCVSRCQETGPYSTNITEEVRTSSNATIILLHCDCFDGCEDLKSCCLDYRSVCVFDVSTVDTTDVELYTATDMISTNITVSTPTIPTTTPTTTSKPPTTTPRPTTVVIPKVTSTTPTLKPILPTTTPKATTKITPTTKLIPTTKDIPSTVTPSTVKLTTPTTPATTRPTTIKTTLKTTPKPIIPTKRTTLMPTTIKKTTTQKVTPVITKITTTSTSAIPMIVTTDAIYTSTTSIPVTNFKNSDDDWRPDTVSKDTDPLPKNLLYMFGGVLIIALIGVVSIKMFRKYYQSGSYKGKRCSKDASEDVRFLTENEQLDFTMQTEESSNKW